VSDGKARVAAEYAERKKGNGYAPGCRKGEERWKGERFREERRQRRGENKASTDSAADGPSSLRPTAIVVVVVGGTCRSKQ
jgi:hypothetical protein